MYSCFAAEGADRIIHLVYLTSMRVLHRTAHGAYDLVYLPMFELLLNFKAVDCRVCRKATSDALKAEHQNGRLMVCRISTTTSLLEMLVAARCIVPAGAYHVNDCPVRTD